MSKTPDPVKFVCQDFRPLFDAPGEFDRPGAAHLIKLARDRVKELRALRAEAAKKRRAVAELAAKIQGIIANVDPMRSP